MRQHNSELGRQTPRNECVRRAVRAGLLTLTLLTACVTTTNETNRTDEPKKSVATSSPSTTELSPVYEALRSLRNTVAQAKPVQLFFMRDVCIAWPNRYGYTVVHNPAVYIEDEGAFFPFVSKLGEIMDGPSIDLDKQGNFGFAKNVTPSLEFRSNVIVFEDITETLVIDQFEPATRYTPAWLQTSDGTRIAETTGAEAGQLNDAFPGMCTFESSPELN